MRLVQVEAVPGRKGNHRLKAVWEEFMGMNVKVAKAELDVGEYKSVEVAQTVWHNSINRFGFPITVTRRNGEIYLIRRDM